MVPGPPVENHCHSQICPSLSEQGSFFGVEGGTNQALKTGAASYWFPNLSVSPLPLDRQLPDRGEQRLASLSDSPATDPLVSFFVSYQHCRPKINNLSERYSWEGGSVTFMTVSHSYLIQSVSRENLTNSAAVTLAFSRHQLILHVHMSQTTGSFVYFGRI